MVNTHGLWQSHILKTLFLENLPFRSIHCDQTFCKIIRSVTKLNLKRVTRFHDSPSTSVHYLLNSDFCTYGDSLHQILNLQNSCLISGDVHKEVLSVSSGVWNFRRESSLRDFPLEKIEKAGRSWNILLRR